MSRVYLLNQPLQKTNFIFLYHVRILSPISYNLPRLGFFPQPNLHQSIFSYGYLTRHDITFSFFLLPSYFLKLIMSLVHLRKSVLTLHLREMVEDGQTNNQLAILGLGAILFGPLVAPTVAKMGRPVAKAVIKSGLSLYEQSKNTLAEIGEEFADNLAEFTPHRGS